MFAAFLGGWEILLILLSLLFMLAMVGGIVALVIVLTRTRKPATVPPSPTPEPPAKSPATVPQTEVIPVKCPQCGTPLPTGALAGLCPACLLKMGAAADTVTDAKQPAFNPPPGRRTRPAVSATGDS